MRPRKLIVRCFLYFAVIYAILMAAWPVMDAPYSAAFRFVSSIVFGELGPAASARFETMPPLSTHEPSMDTNVVLRNHRNGARGTLSMSSRHMAYVPTIMIVALVLATPLPRPRRWRTLLLALAAVHLFIGLRVLLRLLAIFCGSDALATFTLTSAGDATISFLSEMISMSLTASYLGPILIWIIVSFRAGDWEVFATSPKR